MTLASQGNSPMLPKQKKPEGLNLLGQWLNLKNFSGITYLVGKISRSNFYSRVHWLRWRFFHAKVGTLFWMKNPSHKLNVKNLSSWWFQTLFLIFTPNLGKIPIFHFYFSNGLKPPTSCVCFFLVFFLRILRFYAIGIHQT